MNYIEASWLCVSSIYTKGMVSQLASISDLILDFLRILKMEFIILNLLMNKNHGFYDISFLVIKCGKMFVGVISIKPS
jgi:hypothetical protein